MRRFLLSFFVLLSCYFVAFSQIKINEIQSSNSKTIKHPQTNEFADWIELYNTSTSSVNIGGFYLTDNKNEPRKWQIPIGTSIAAKGYLLIWCDGRNLNLNTNFKLSADGETVLLYSSAMLLHDSVTFPVIETDFTYGRTVNGAGTWALLSMPTPGTSNVSTVVKGIAPSPTFSLPGGFYNSNQSVSISTTIPGAVIRYTTDGSEPTASSPIYTGAITAQKTNKVTLKYGYNRDNNTGVKQFSWNSGLSYPYNYYSGNRDFGFVIKAKVFHNDYVPSNTAGATYFINMTKPSLPVVALSTDKGNLFSADSGIYIQGTNGLTKPVNNYTLKCNWFQDWERKVYVEYFDVNGSRKFGVSAGAEIMGAVSRNTDMKSFVIAMKNKYEQGKINYPLFGSSGLTSYTSFLLRNSGNDWEQGNMARDAIIQSIVRGQVDIETQAYQPVVLYINGEYWGLINMRERFDKHNFAGYYDYVDSDDIDLLKIDSDNKTYTASDGDLERYNEMMSFVNSATFSNQQSYNILKTRYVDIDNLINYYIAQIYCQNTDWPHNNVRMWRPRSENGKFRFPLYDTDFGYGLWGGGAYENALSRVMSSSATHAWSTVLFRKLMVNEDFKNEFIQRYAYMINTVYATSRLETIANSIENTIKNERTISDDEWTRGVNSGYNTSSMISWGTSRRGYAKDHINSQFGSKGWQTLTVRLTESQGAVFLCGLPVADGYSGQQYANTPIRLQAIPADGYRFVRWENGAGASVATTAEYKLSIAAAYTIRAVFEARPTVTNLKINEILASNKSIIQNEVKKYDDWVELYNSGTTAIDVAGLYISDDAAQPLKYKIPYGSPDSTTIQPGGYLLLWANNRSEEGALHLPFKLNKDGGIVRISQKSSSGSVTTIDNLTYGQQNTDISFGRYPDANANLIVFTVPTPRSSNTVQSATFVDNLIITEFMAKNGSTIKEETGSYADWIEIYNNNNFAVDLGGLFVTDDIAVPNKFMIPKGQSSLTTVAAKSYYLLWADKQTAINPNHVDFRLSAVKGSIAIVQVRGAQNYIIDQVSYINQGEDVSYGRFPTVTSTFQYLVQPTPGAANTNSLVIAKKTGLTINEVLAWNTGTVADEHGGYSDYIEFYNASSSPIDLGGLFVSDSLPYSLRYRIPRTNPSATTVQPGSWITFWADGKPSQGILHLDFSLSQLGEDVVLSQVTHEGIQILDSKTFGVQSENVSYGRFPENGTHWESMTPTYNAKNVSIFSSTALKTLTASYGVITPALSSSVTQYVCTIPEGSSTVPTISATAMGTGASVTITQASNLSSTAKVSVISANGNYTQDYLITFAMAPSPDASLKSLTVASGTLSPSFNATVYDYVVAVSGSSVPLLSAVPNQKNAMVQVQYAQNLLGTTTITVTAESGDIQIYSITYTSQTQSQVLYSWVDNFNSGSISPWSITGTSASYYTISAENEKIKLEQAAGKPGYRTFVYNLPEGYVLDLENNANPILKIDVLSDKDVEIRIDLKDASGTGNVNTISKTALAGVQTTLTYDFTTKCTNIDKSKVTGLVFYTDPDITVNTTKTILFDNLIIGLTQSSNANLATLTASAGTLSPTFNANTTNYTLTLPAGTSTIPTISATRADTKATLEISQASYVDGVAKVRVIAEDKTTIKEYTINLVVTPTVVQGFTDHIIQPSMKGWAESSALYDMQYLGGEVAVNYYRTASGGSDAITYNITEAQSRILNLSTYPYVAIRLKTTVALDVRIDLFDANGYVTNATPVSVVANGGAYVTYIFNYTGKFSQVNPAQTVQSSDIRGIKIMFDAGSTSPKSGVVTIDKLLFGNHVDIPVNNPPVITTIPNQTVMQGQSFNTILLNNYVSDDHTPVSSLVWSASTATNFTVSISNNVATISAKNSSWIGSETIVFTVTDLDGASSTRSVTFSVTELKIPVESISFTQSSLSVSQNQTVDISSYLSIYPANATLVSVVWSEASANASISSAGVLTNALDYGTESVTVTVTVTDKNNNVYTKTIQVVLTGCPTQLSSVSISPTTVSITEGHTLQLQPLYSPLSACIKTVSYTSTNTNVVTVSSIGLITGVSPGTAIITIHVNDGFTTKSASRTVTVTKDCSGDIVLSLNQNQLEVVKLLSATLIASISPNDECTQNNTVTWVSSHPTIVSVVDGVVTAHQVGQATITASTTGTGTISAQCVVTVLDNCISGALQISAQASLSSIYFDQTSTITAEVLTENPCNGELQIIALHPEIATITNGIVSPVSYGTALFRVQSVQHAASFVDVQVVVAERLVESILMPSTLQLYAGDSAPLSIVAQPTNADNKSLTITSSLPTIATYSNGQVFGAIPGQTIITVVAASGVTAQCVVTVLEVFAVSVQLNASEIILQENETQQMVAMVSPVNTTYASVVWTSSNNDIATVSATGLIQAKQSGTVTITATTSNNISAHVLVTVEALTTPVESVVISKKSATLYLGEFLSLSADVLPLDATNKSVLWLSSDDAVASVSQTGLVTPKMAGSALIIVKSNNDKADTCIVLVQFKPIQSVSFSQNQIEVGLAQPVDLNQYLVLNPENVEIQSIQWIESDPDFVISPEGFLTHYIPYGSKTTSFSVIVTDKNGNAKTASVSLVISGCNVQVESASVVSSEVYVSETETHQISLQYAPVYACVSSIVYESSHPAIASVNQSGLVTAHIPGSATISITVHDGVSFVQTSVVVNVLQLVILPTSVSIGTNQSLGISESKQLVALVLPENAHDTSVQWSTSNSGIVTVSESGFITGISAGIANITATTVNNKQATISVTVSPIPVSSVTFDMDYVQIFVTQSKLIASTVLPENATDKNLVWTSSDTSIAEVTNGLVFGKKDGICTITATAHNGKFYECIVLVEHIYPSSITLSVANPKMNVSSTQVVQVSILPSTVTDSGLQWQSSNSSCVQVNQNGVLTAVAPGIATITATSANNVKGTIQIEVNPILASSVSLNVTNIVLFINENQQLFANVSPSNTTNKNVSWTSSDTSVVFVDANGRVFAKKIGQGIITVETSNGKTDQCTVNVVLYTVPVSSVILEKKTLSLYVDQSETLIAQILPESATNKTLVWSSDKISVAQVDQSSGKITAKSVGTATIVVTTSNNLTDTCIVTVLPILVDSVELVLKSVTLGESDTYKLFAQVYPSNATNQTISWLTLNPQVATISLDGTITAVSAGVTKVYAMSNNGLLDSCDVHVIQNVVPVESISMPNSVYISIDDNLTIPVTFNPSNATNQNLVWESSDPLIASVNQIGKITGESAGNATITATSHNQKKAYAVITVLPMLAEQVVFDTYQISIITNDTYQIGATVLPLKTTDKSLVWSSSNESVAVVENGLVQALYPGIVEITATTSNGKKATSIVEVLPITASKIEVEENQIKLMVSQTHQIEAKIVPDNVTFPIISWVSSDENVVTVDANGLVTAVGVGNALVTGTKDNVEVKVDFTISLYNEAPKVVQIPAQIITVGESFEAINLQNYFSDDNTSLDNILWSANAQGSNILMSITSKGIASVMLVDKTWKGSEVITVYATDEQGETTGVDVLYVVNPKVNVEQVVSSDLVELYPNPSMGISTLQIASEIASYYSIKLYSAQGAIVYSDEIWVEGVRSYLLQLNSLVKGTYYVVVSNGVQSHRIPLILR